MMSLRPPHRICCVKFREDGILLPFGHSRKGFDIPNPTFFQCAEWAMQESADPLEGYKFQELLDVKTGPATNDMYGKLYFHVVASLSAFRARLSTCSLSFRLLHVDARAIGEHVERGSFDRIETSNIADGGLVYVGTEGTLAAFAPLLRSPDENPHATLITLYMNAVEEMATVRESYLKKPDKGEMRRLAAYLKDRITPRPGDMLDSQRKSKTAPFLMHFVRSLVRDVEDYFDDYMVEMHDFKGVGQRHGVEMKAANTIIEDWPLRLKLKPGQPGAQEEFDLLMNSPHMGNERYVEWKRTA